jgi:signal transduction histidine kinase
MSGSSSIRIRLIAFTVSIISLAVLVAWAAKTSWDQFEALHERTEEERLGSFRIADEFQANIYRLNYTLVRFGTREAGAELERFQRESQELNTWLDQRKTLRTTPRERAVLDQIDRAYDAYLIAARKVIAIAQQSDNGRLIFEAVETAAESSKPLLDLGSALVMANHEAHEQWREDFHKSVGQLQVVIFGSLICLLALAGGTSIFVYRQMIAPLRTQLVESRELVARQEKLASLGVLAAGVAHEIRNPLTAIKVRLFTLRKELAAAALGDEDLEVISVEISRLERIVKDFLHFARPSEPKLETLNAFAVVSAVGQLMRGKLAKGSIDLKLESSTDTHIRVDPDQLKQVLINLVRNAAESIVNAGTVILRVREEIAVIQSRRQPCVFIEVEDTGTGIPTELQQRVFDPFFTTKETGTGLGLSIAARTVERHGGVLRFQTRLKQGTTFTILLPAVRK